MKRLCSLLMISLPFLSFACGSSDSAQETSEIKWAHVPVNSSMSIINSRLAYLDLGFKADFTNIAVCVQSAAGLGGSDLLLETKLAYATWLDASAQGSAALWQRFAFVVQDHCNMQDNTFSSVIVIGDQAKITADEEVERTFQPNQVSCRKSGGSANCSTGSMTLGLGGPGSIGFSFFKQGIWNSVSNRSPATVILSPYAKWQPLAFALPAALATEYHALSSRADALSYDELTHFSHELQDQKLIAKSTDQLGLIVKNFLNSSSSSMTQNYLPEQSAFHVLLHEVGHQFGMDHADNPSLDSETGTTGTAVLSSDSQWETKISTMAYADEYLYLTADDAAGIKDLAGKSLVFVKSHKP